MRSFLNSTAASIFRIIHHENLEWWLMHGFASRNTGKPNPNHRAIGKAEIIAKRSSRPIPIPPGGTLDDYIPFYFTPFSPMAYNIATGHSGIPQVPNEDILILFSSLPHLSKLGVPFVFTDRHALTATARFFSNLDELSEIGWPALQNRDFKNDPEDPGKFDRYMAEALVRDRLPFEALIAIAAYTPEARARVDSIARRHGVAVTSMLERSWYF